MKNTIKKILKEQVNNLSNINKGVDVAVKLLSKEFPFIVGWEFSEPIYKWEYTLYVNLLVDLDKAKEYYGLDLNSLYGKYGIDILYDDDNSEKAYPFSALDYESKIKDAYIEYKKIYDELKDIYGDLPNKFKMVRNEFYDDKSKDLTLNSFKYVR